MVQKKTVPEAIIDYLRSEGASGPKEIAESTGKNQGTVSTALRRMDESGDVVRVKYGVYDVPEHVDSEPEDAVAVDGSTTKGITLPIFEIQGSDLVCTGHQLVPLTLGRRGMDWKRAIWVIGGRYEQSLVQMWADPEQTLSGWTMDAVHRVAGVRAEQVRCGALHDVGNGTEWVLVEVWFNASGEPTLRSDHDTEHLRIVGEEIFGGHRNR